jgi:NAD(P)-dependent dehydrogenase (short-subunit alcohol dehydrogenase family)
MSLLTLKDQRVVIIGGSSGIGYAVAEGALGEGAHVVIGSTSKAKVDAAVERLGSAASGIVVDAQDESSVAEFFSAVGAFDHLVFTAAEQGTNLSVGPIGQMDIAAAAQALGVRFWGALTAIKHSHSTISPNGSITLTDGVLSIMPLKGAFLATAFGGTIEHLVRGLAMDLAPLRVNSVCPGLVFTERTSPWGDDNIRKFTEHLPVPRAGTADEAAQAYLYLMRGGYTTGQVIVVDGGRSLV